MSTGKLVWNETEQVAKAAFSIANIGRLNSEVRSELPGAGARQTPEERHALALTRSC